MTTHDSIRRLALSLPETAEQDHHGLVSYRVRNKIFATIPDEDHVRIMVDESEIHAAVAEHPAVCEPFYWGKRLACVVVNVQTAGPELIQELLTAAWLRKAPNRLAGELGGQG